MSAQSLRIGIVGLGQMGRNHLRVLSLLKGVEIAFLVDRDAELTARLGRLHDLPTGSELGPMLHRADAVVIATPTLTHGATLRQVAAQVENIFVEKPMAASLEETEVLVRFVEDRRLRGLVELVF